MLPKGWIAAIFMYLVTMIDYYWDKLLFPTLFMPPNKIWGMIKSDCLFLSPSVRPFVCPSVQKKIFLKGMPFKLYIYWGHLSRTVTQFLLLFISITRVIIIYINTQIKRVGKKNLSWYSPPSLPSQTLPLCDGSSKGKQIPFCIFCSPDHTDVSSEVS